MSIQLFRGDCLDVLRSLPDGSVDAVVTDPPYNVGLDYASSSDQRCDYKNWCREWLSELDRVCDGPILFTCGTVNLSLWYEIKKPHWVLCWWKPASSSRCTVGFNNWEPVLYYGKKKLRGACDVVRTTEQASLPVNHKKYPIAHPCPKPIEWAEKLIGISRGDTVLDPFMGSGTTGVACVNTGRNFIGVELDHGYFEIAKRRISEAESDRKTSNTQEAQPCP